MSDNPRIVVVDGRDQPGMERHNDVKEGDIIWHSWNCVRTELEPGTYELVKVDDEPPPS